jgi:hypothetical protein
MMFHNDWLKAPNACEVTYSTPKNTVGTRQQYLEHRRNKIIIQINMFWKNEAHYPF